MEAYRKLINNTQFNETKKLSQLRTDYGYPVREFKIVKTKYGISKIATLYDPESQPDVFDVFLPIRFNDVAFDDDTYQHYLIYHGEKVGKNSKEYHNIRFEILERIAQKTFTLLEIYDPDISNLNEELELSE